VGPVHAAGSLDAGKAAAEFEGFLRYTHSTYKALLQNDTAGWSALDPRLDPTQANRLINANPNQINLLPNHGSGESLIRLWKKSKQHIIKDYHQELDPAYQELVNQIRILGDPNQPFYEEYKKQNPTDSALFYKIEKEDPDPNKKAQPTGFYQTTSEFNADDPLIHPRIPHILYKAAGITKDYTYAQAEDLVAQMPTDTGLQQRMKAIANAFINLKKEEAKLYQGFLQRVQYLRGQIAQGNGDARVELQHLLETSPFSTLKNSKESVEYAKQKIVELSSNDEDRTEGVAFLDQHYNALLNYEMSGRANLDDVRKNAQAAASLNIPQFAPLKNAMGEILGEANNAGKLHSSVENDPFALNFLLNLRKRQETENFGISPIDVTKAKVLGQGRASNSLRRSEPSS